MDCIEFKCRTLKLLTTISFFLFFCNVYGQKWHLNKVNEASEYKYEYWFHFDNEEDTSSFVLRNIIGQSTPTIHLRNNNGDTIDFAIIKIKNLKSGIEYGFLSQDIGQFNLKPGDYNITVSAMNYDHFAINFKLKKNQSIDLNVKLGLSSESVVYQINAKEKLSDVEMSTIVNCIRESESDFNKCSIKNKYSVTMHI
jgi:hypothetical protein